MKLLLAISILFLNVWPELYAQDAAEEAIDSIKVVLPLQEAKEKVKSFNELAWYYKNFDIDSALYFSNQSFLQAETTQNKKAIASAYNSLANTYEALGDLDSAELFHMKGISIKLELKDSLGLASSYNNLGIVYDEMGNFDHSLQQYFLSLELYEQYPDHKYDVAMVLGNIGIVYKKQKSYDKVLEYYRKALDIYQEVGSEFGKTVTKGNIGSLLINMQQFEESITYSKEALIGYQELGYVRYVPYMYRNIAVANDSLHDYIVAGEYYQQSIEGHFEHQNHFELSATLNAQANSYLQQKKYGLALKSADEALKYAADVNATDIVVSARKYAAIANNGLGNYKNAYSNLYKHQVGKDSIFNMARTKKIEELRTKYETGKKEQQIAIKDLELAEQKNMIQQNIFLVIGLIIVVIFILIVAMLLRSRMKKKQQLALRQKELDFRELQLSAVIDSQEKERKRFASDLHDGFGQLISVLKMNVAAINKENATPEKKNELFEKSTEILNGMYDELRGICFNLMPHTLVQQGLVAALQEFVGRVNLSGKVTVEVLVFDFEERLDDLKEISIYRIVQEWVNNILKYNDATKITVQLTKDDKEITLTVEDNGQGFEKNLLMEGRGNGWKNMNSRSNLIKGVLEIDTNPQLSGSTLILNVPQQKKNVIEAVAS